MIATTSVGKCENSSDLSDPDTTLGGFQTRFPETRHSLIGGAKDHAANRETLIAAYWKPSYKYIRVQWRKSNEDAKDLTQSFFALALEKDFFQGFDASKARFRTYLRASLDNHVRNHYRAEHSEKRSPGNALLSLDFVNAELEIAQDPPDPGRSMDEYFQDEWVRHLFTQAVETLRQKYEDSGREKQFGIFSRYDLNEDSGELTYDRLAAEFNIPPTQVTNYLAAARRDFRRIVVEQIRAITANEREFRAEMRAVLGSE